MFVIDQVGQTHNPFLALKRQDRTAIHFLWIRQDRTAIHFCMDQVGPENASDLSQILHHPFSAYVYGYRLLSNVTYLCKAQLSNGIRIGKTYIGLSETTKQKVKRQEYSNFKSCDAKWSTVNVLHKQYIYLCARQVGKYK